jgi:MtN3 and saliva related transmembrane protein
MNWELINGYVGGVLSAALFVPQLYKMYQTQSAIELSWTFLIVSNVGSVFSIFYYIEIDATPMIYTNAFSLLTRIIMIIYKYHLDQKNKGYVLMENGKVSMMDV